MGNITEKLFEHDQVDSEHGKQPWNVNDQIIHELKWDHLKQICEEIHYLVFCIVYWFETKNIITRITKT